MKNPLIIKFSDFKSVLVSGQTSKSYSKTGKHLLLTFWDIMWKTDRQTNKQITKQTNKHMNAADNPIRATAAGVGRYTSLYKIF